jgi:hypothetical protein
MPTVSDVTQNPVENVFWTSTPPSGTYLIKVKLSRRCSESDFIDFTVTVRKDREIVGIIRDSVSSPGEERVYEFPFSS